jgi:hypothetical protein
MEEYEWDEYIDDIIFNTTDGQSVGDWDASKVHTRLEKDEEQLIEACNRLKAVDMRVNVHTLQKELKLMGREHPMNSGFIHGFLEDFE